MLLLMVWDRSFFLVACCISSTSFSATFQSVVQTVLEFIYSDQLTSGVRAQSPGVGSAGASASVGSEASPSPLDVAQVCSEQPDPPLPAFPLPAVVVESMMRLNGLDALGRPLPMGAARLDRQQWAQVWHNIHQALQQRTQVRFQHLNIDHVDACITICVFHAPADHKCGADRILDSLD
jgi:hypothetical protein